MTLTAPGGARDQAYEDPDVPWPYEHHGHAPPSPDETTPPHSSWRPVDLGPVLDGTYQRPEPTVGHRDDGKGLFYPGRIHVIAAEAEAGKTWFALAAIAEELTLGNACVYLDFEDDEGGITGRLITMGCDRQAIRKRFAYIRPEEPVSGRGRTDLNEVIGDLRPTLAVIDGVTEAMTLHGLELKDNSDVAAFGRMLPRWIADRGPAVVALDHVVKDREARGGHAIGGVHKLNGLNGAMYLLENKKPFGIGLTGLSRVLIRKDRPGQLRRHGIQSHDGLFWYADLQVRSHHEDFAEASLPAPEDGSGGVFRPTAIMTAISKALTAAGAGLSKNAIEGAVTGRAATVRYALELLVSEGYVAAERNGRTILHKLARPYPGDLPRPFVPTSSHLVPDEPFAYSSIRPSAYRADELDEDEPAPPGRPHSSRTTTRRKRRKNRHERAPRQRLHRCRPPQMASSRMDHRRRPVRQRRQLRRHHRDAPRPSRRRRTGKAAHRPPRLRRPMHRKPPTHRPGDQVTAQ